MKKNIEDRLNDMLQDMSIDLENKDECSSEETLEKIKAKLAEIKADPELDAYIKLHANDAMSVSNPVQE